MFKKSTRAISAVAGAVAATTALFLVVGQPDASAAGRPATTATGEPGAPVERGRIVGWPGGDAVIYQTVGFFGTPQILAVGAVHPDGSFTVRLPGTVPVDLLDGSEGCSTLQSTFPALSTFTGNGLIYQHGKQIGATHSGSSFGIASFTGFIGGDTRSGLVYADRATKWTGFCDRTITVGQFTADFRQNFDVTLHRGWNEVEAVISTPAPGQVVADLRNGGNPAEKWFFFGSSTTN